VTAYSLCCAWLVLVAVPPTREVCDVWCVARIEVVHEAVWPIVNGEAQDGHVVRVQNTCRHTNKAVGGLNMGDHDLWLCRTCRAAHAWECSPGWTCCLCSTHLNAHNGISSMPTQCSAPASSVPQKEQQGADIFAPITKPKGLQPVNSIIMGRHGRH
jgi:hypothetical protein